MSLKILLKQVNFLSQITIFTSKSTKIIIYSYNEEEKFWVICSTQ